MKQILNRILGIVCILFLCLGFFSNCQDDSEVLGLKQDIGSSTDEFLNVEKLSQPAAKTKGSNVCFTKDEKVIVYKAFTRIVENASDENGQYVPSRLSAKALNMDEDLFSFSLNILNPYLEGKKAIGEGYAERTITPRMKTRTEGGGDFGGGSEGYASAEDWLIAKYTKDQIYEMICSQAFDSDFEKKCFKQYFYALGDMDLSSDDWNGIKNAVKELNNFSFSKISIIDNRTVDVGTVSFYNHKDYNYALGTSTIYKETSTKEYIGFYDKYDFNINADRTFEAQIGTIIIGPICKMLGAEPYEMRFGICDK